MTLLLKTKKEKQKKTIGLKTVRKKSIIDWINGIEPCNIDDTHLPKIAKQSNNNKKCSYISLWSQQKKKTLTLKNTRNTNINSDDSGNSSKKNQKIFENLQDTKSKKFEQKTAKTMIKKITGTMLQKKTLHDKINLLIFLPFPVHQQKQLHCYESSNIYSVHQTVISNTEYAARSTVLQTDCF